MYWLGKFSPSAAGLSRKVLTRKLADALKCVHGHAMCSGADKWKDESAKAKMRLRAFICSTYEKGPDIGLGNIWRDEPTLIPVKDTAFDQVAAFLQAI